LIVLALVLFGAKRLPEVGRAAGNAIREFKAALNGETSGKKSEVSEMTNTEEKGDGNA
jgi:sec-independent protein translocase protein TatA